MILKRSTAAALSKAREDLAGVETEIARLQSERLSKLLDAEPGEIERIDQRIADQHRAANVFRDRIAGLEQRLSAEQAEHDKQRYQQAVAKIEAALPRREKAAEQVERAFAGLASAVKEFMLATEGVLKAWPEGVEWPSRVFPAHALSLERVGRLVQEVFTPSRGFADKRPPSPSEYLARACNADRHSGFAQREKELNAEFLADLKTAHDPAPIEAENEEAA